MASSEQVDPTTGVPSPGHLVVVEAGRSTVLTVEPGKRLLVGRDPDAEIRVSDRKVGERHATIERRGEGWAVQDVDALRPTRLIDAWGTNRQVRGETTISSGQLVLGDVLITLYANRP
jgi:pSer/pThr/pTyr-binding forkhead associated (FHA) protein